MSKIINISLPEDLVAEIDKAAKNEYASRSDYIRETLVRRLKGQRIVDEWGDDGTWETIVDFSSVNPSGVPIKEVIEALENLEKLDEQNRKTPSKAGS